MSISDKLTTIAQNEQEINNLGKRINQIMFDKDASLNETANNMEQLNNTMESILYGDNGTEGDLYNLFWDTYQLRGGRTGYTYAFANPWTDELFFPKYDIICTGHNASVFAYSKITRLASKLKELGLTFDTSKVTTFLQWFQGSNIKDIPVLDCSNATSLSYTFGTSSKVETIEKLILSDKITTVANAFEGCSKLTHVIFDGIIAITGLNLKWSTKLDTESIVSLIETLSPTTSGMSVTLSQTAVNNMVFPITSEKTNTTYNNWNELTGTKTNWTITLV